MLTLGFVAAVHAVAAALVMLGLVGFVVLTYRHEDGFDPSQARANLKKVDTPKVLVHTVLAVVLSALVGATWFSVLTLAEALV